MPATTDKIKDIIQHCGPNHFLNIRSPRRLLRLVEEEEEINIRNCSRQEIKFEARHQLQKSC